MHGVKGTLPWDVGKGCSRNTSAGLSLPEVQNDVLSKESFKIQNRKYVGVAQYIVDKHIYRKSFINTLQGPASEDSQAVVVITFMKLRDTDWQLIVMRKWPISTPGALSDNQTHTMTGKVAEEA